jgi:hypothetical protein
MTRNAQPLMRLAIAAAPGERVTSPPAERSAARAGGSALIQTSRIALFAMLGCLIVFVPTLGQPQQDRWFWVSVGALVCAAMEFAAQLGAPLRCRDHVLLPCLAAILAGVSLDFLRVSPQALLDLCSARIATSSFGWYALSEHGRWFPATTLAMFAAIAWPRLRAWRMRDAVAVGAATLAIVIVSEFAAMAIAMSAAMASTRAFAMQVRVSWEAAALVCAMLVGMGAFFLARRAIRVARDWVSKATDSNRGKKAR